MFPIKQKLARWQVNELTMLPQEDTTKQSFLLKHPPTKNGFSLLFLMEHNGVINGQPKYFIRFIYDLNHTEF